MRKNLLLLLVFVLLGINTTPAQETTFRNLGLEFKYSSNLKIVRDMSTDNLMVLTNFDGKWLHGGFIPRNGVEINIIRYQKDRRGLEQLITETTLDGDDKIISRRPYLVNGQSGIKIISEIDFQVFKITRTQVYVDRGQVVYKFLMDWDENSSEHETFSANFDQLLSTVKFLQ